VCSAAIHGDVDAIPAEPKVFATVVVPPHYKSDPTSQELLRALATHPTFLQLRRIGQFTTYAANDPDFQHRWQTDKMRLPQALERPCIFVCYYAQATPTPTYTYRADIGNGGRKNVETLAADLAKIVPRLKRAAETNWQPAQIPPAPQFAQRTPVNYASSPYTTTYTYTYSYGRPRIRIFRPRNPDNCPDCVNPVGPQPHVDPTTDPNAPIRPLLPPIDDTVTFPPDSEPTTPPIGPSQPDQPLLPPAPLEPPPPDPRIDEQQEQLEKQAETIKQLQQTIHQLQQTVVNVQPARDYAPDINAIKRDVEVLQVAHVEQQKVNVIVAGLKQAQEDQMQVNKDLIASIKGMADARNTLMVELNQMKDDITAQVEKPFWIRLVDPRGKYTTEAKEVRLGQQVDLSLEPIASSSGQAGG
jgi:hypothetical protein